MNMFGNSESEVQKTWVAVGRRSDDGIPLDFLWELCLNRLVDNGKEGPLQSVILPDTIVYRPADQIKWYYTSEKRGIVQKKPNQINPTAIRRALMFSGSPEGPVAVWHSERKDSKGYLTTQEFFDEKMLCAFLKSKSDRGRCGVLQRFVLPKDIKGKEGVNHELLVVSDSYITIERRHNNALLEPSKQFGVTQQACVHPGVTVVGKLNPPPCSATAPHPPHEVNVGFDELQSSALLAVICPAMRALTERFSATRHEVLHESGSRERELSCTFKVDRQNQLWLLGFVRLKSQDALDWVVPDFEFIKRRKKAAEGAEQEKVPDFNFALTSDNTDPAPPPPAARDASPKKCFVRASKKDAFLCPNCSAVIAKQDIHVTTYLSVLRYYDRKTKEVMQTVKSFTRDGPGSLRGGGGPAASGPPGDALSSLLSPQAFNDASHNWMPIPPVLQRLSRSVEELRKKNVWLHRQVSLCRDCYMSFFDPHDENEQLQKCFEREELRKCEYLDRKVWASSGGWATDRSHGGGAGLVNNMVFTNLQQHHRTIQWKTKKKASHRRILHTTLSSTQIQQPTAPAGSTGGMSPQATPLADDPRGSPGVQPAPPPVSVEKPPGYSRIRFGPASYPITSAWATGAASPKATGVGPGGLDAAEESCMAYYQELEPEGATGTEFESSASAVLSNYLYEEFGKQLQCAYPPEGGVEDVPPTHTLHSVYGEGKNRLPVPEPRVAITILPSDPARVAEREAQMQTAKHRSKAHTQISEVLPLFTSLSQEERELLLSVVAASYARESEKAKQALQKQKQDERA